MPWGTPEYHQAVQAAKKAARAEALKELKAVFSALADNANLIQDPTVKAAINKNLTEAKQTFFKLGL